MREAVANVRVIEKLPNAATARTDDAEPIRHWLTDFARAVREVDYEAGRRMFAPDVIGFGTVNEILHGLDALESRQWRSVWGITRGFDFDYSTVHIDLAGDRAAAVALWSSQGRNDRGWFDRQGRATFLFARRGGDWRAVHSHLSLVPVPPAKR
jgi:ketosteroid isomerase-like protein